MNIMTSARYYVPKCGKDGPVPGGTMPKARMELFSLSVGLSHFKESTIKSKALRHQWNPHPDARLQMRLAVCSPRPGSQKIAETMVRISPQLISTEPI